MSKFEAKCWVLIPAAIIPSLSSVLVVAIYVFDKTTWLWIASVLHGLTVSVFWLFRQITGYFTIEITTKGLKRYRHIAFRGATLRAPPDLKIWKKWENEKPGRSGAGAADVVHCPCSVISSHFSTQLVWWLSWNTRQRESTASAEAFDVRTFLSYKKTKGFIVLLLGCATCLRCCRGSNQWREERFSDLSISAVVFLQTGSKHPLLLEWGFPLVAWWLEF